MVSYPGCQGWHQDSYMYSIASTRYITGASNKHYILVFTLHKVWTYQDGRESYCSTLARMRMRMPYCLVHDRVHLKVSFNIFDSSKKRGGAAKMEKDVLVAFEDRIEIVERVKWNTTAETFIKRYINQAANLKHDIFT